MFDTNVLLDIFLKRELHYEASARCVSKVAEGAEEGLICAHVATTLYYLVDKYADNQRALDAIEWLLDTFAIVPCTEEILRDALRSPVADFEDAVVALSAQAASCDTIITRNTTDFVNSLVRAITPGDFLTKNF